jgi:putative heme-binding domain-containing protein
MISIRKRAAVSVAVTGLSLCLTFAMAINLSHAQQAPAKNQAKKQAKGAAKKKPAAPATPAPPVLALDKIKSLKGFKVELIHTVPREKEGSWVSITVDPKGRLIASDQYGKLYRITPPALGGKASDTKVEALKVEIGEAQGLLWAFDSLYVVVNSGGKFPSGLYRARDTDGDDQLDKVELLRAIKGGGEHGPHGIVLAPDGKSLYVVAGNATTLPEISSSLVPKVWGEDNLLPRMTDGRGFMADEKAPGGFICRVDPEGKNWELVSMGYRNPYDIALNRNGHLFTYDSDMEWDVNTPWYRPTRVLEAASGADFGYRNGAGKWPVYYMDSLPPVVNIGPGSPTGIAFGYGAKFPAKYQEALFISDWSYGKLYAVHLKAKGATYVGELEEFVTGAPLPLTDMVIHPDGSLYFAIGGRRTSSSLYRVVYTGDESTATSTSSTEGAEARADRAKLEAFHGHADAKAVDTAWPFLSNADRSLRYAARVAIEWQDMNTWKDKALSETNPQAALESLLALTQVSTPDPAHRKPSDPALDVALRGKILEALDRLQFDTLSAGQKVDLARVYTVVFNRMGKPESDAIAKLVAKFDAQFPAKGRELSVELANLLAYFDSNTIAAKGVEMLTKAPTQEEQIDYARVVRFVKTGWTPELRKTYFSWFLKSSRFKGGASFSGFMTKIKNDAVAGLSDAEKAELKPILEAPATSGAAIAAVTPRAHVKDWTLDELVPIVESGLKQKRDFDRGRTLFAAASCFACHRYDNEGGSNGPDLSSVAGRFSSRDLLESIIVPSKVISDQYGAIIVSTTDGRVVTGRVVNMNNDSMSINVNMLEPDNQVGIDRNKIEEIKNSPISMMPAGLLNTLKQDEIIDLVAYLLSRGDRENPMFK